MTHFTADTIHRSLGGLNRKPALTVVILLLVALAIAVFAMWLGTASGPNSRRPELFYVVGMSTADHHREFI